MEEDITLEWMQEPDDYYQPSPQPTMEIFSRNDGIL
jgi:hypothetical protein